MKRLWLVEKRFLIKKSWLTKRWLMAISLTMLAAAPVLAGDTKDSPPTAQGDTSTSTAKKPDVQPWHNKMGCRMQKTSNRLPPGAPLPDVDISQDDKISAREAFTLALKFEKDDYLVEATEYYERAINALRRPKAEHDKQLTQEIIRNYAALLLIHRDQAKAEALQKEFLP